MLELTSKHKAAIVAQLRAQRIGTQTWVYGNSGTPFKVFAQVAGWRDVERRLFGSRQMIKTKDLR